MSKTAAIELLREAMAAARANDKPTTRKLLREATRLDAANETAWQWLASVAETPLEAVAALERVLGLNPKNEKAKAALRPVRLQAGVAAAKGRDVDTARRLLRAVIADDPRSEQGWLFLASVCDSPAESLAALDRVLALNPASAPAQKGVAYYKAKLATAPQAEVPTVATTASAKTPTAPPVTLRLPPQRTVLVVEDSRTVRKLAAMTLTGAGYRVAEAGDGMEAVAWLRDGGVPDVILLDVAMPGMTGYEFCKLIRSSPDTKHVPVVMLTGKDGFFDKLRGRMAGTDLYLTKPLQPDALLDAVRKYSPAPE